VKQRAETILEACYRATDDIWDDREAYIRAVLDVLGIDPDVALLDFKADYQP
jgi:hypothetical protein